LDEGSEAQASGPATAQPSANSTPAERDGEAAAIDRSSAE
jgi:hypothetical protein